MSGFVDSHCHLDFVDFDVDRDAIVDRARSVGIERMVTICTRMRQFERVLEIARTYDDVFCSVGTHPHNADEETDISARDIIEHCDDPKVVAIGEAGLDYHYERSARGAQARGLRRHIAAARETGLPLVVHSRAADGDMEAILRDEAGKGSFPAVMHCFSSGSALAHAAVDLGLYVSFSGILTFKKSEELRALAADLPSDRLLVETDAPYLAPVPHRGSRNEPAHTRHTLQVLADARGWSFEEAARQTTENFYRLFAKVPRAVA